MPGAASGDFLAGWFFGVASVVLVGVRFVIASGPLAYVADDVVKAPRAGFRLGHVIDDEPGILEPIIPERINAIFRVGVSPVNR